jgi:acyl-CoA dehydrogenase
MNALKISSSEAVVRIASLALSICGMVGYRADGPYSVERHLRDAYSAACMIGNDRLKAANALMLLAQDAE